MHKFGIIPGISCAQLSQYSTAFQVKILVVGNVYALYSSFEQVIHNVFTAKYELCSLLYDGFTHNTQGLLLKLLIYLKKGY